MLTYSDMITLLLALFIILFALKTSSPQKLRAVSRVLASTYDAHTVIGSAPGPSVVEGASGGDAPGSLSGPHPLRAISQTSPWNLLRVAQAIRAAVATGHLAGAATVRMTPEGLLVTLSAAYLFSEGHAALTPQGVLLIRKIGTVLSRLPNPVVVLGATDNLPIRTARYPSNWQLGAMRAANVSAVLGAVPGFQPGRILSATTSKYHPVAPNRTAAGRAKNRRVVIWVIRANTLVNALFEGGTPAGHANTPVNRAGS